VTRGAGAIGADGVRLAMRGRDGFRASHFSSATSLASAETGAFFRASRAAARRLDRRRRRDTMTARRGDHPVSPAVGVNLAPVLVGRGFFRGQRWRTLGKRSVSWQTQRGTATERRASNPT
jgi:hypothetical protein